MAWRTDGGYCAYIAQPEINADFLIIPTGSTGRAVLSLESESDNTLPTPNTPIPFFDLNETVLLAVIKCYPVPPYEVNKEYQIELWATCTYKTASDDHVYDYRVVLSLVLHNITNDTNEEYGEAIDSKYGQSGYALTPPIVYGYLGNDDTTWKNDYLAMGVFYGLRSLTDGSWSTVTPTTGEGVVLNREYLRNTYHVDIHPDDMEPDPEEEDPNEDDDGYSGPGGGDGDHDHSTDDIDIPSLPTLSATATGFVTMYKSNLSQIQAVAAELWTSTIWDALKGLFTDPLDYIVSVDISPVTPELSQGLYYPVVGNVLGVDVRLSTAMNIITNQYVEVDCGTINLSKYYGSALDFSPYEKVQLHLPYIGVKDLDIDEVMGHDIGVKYHCDVMSGACVAFVTINGNSIDRTVRYEYTGNIISHIPITARSFDEVIKSVAALGATAAISSISAGAASGGQIADREGDAQVQGSEAASTMTVKPNIQRAGALSTQLGFLGVQTPYITRTIPRQSLPENYSTYEGYPSNITETLGSLSGFTKVFSIRPNGFKCTTEELDELVGLLKEGIIL